MIRFDCDYTEGAHPRILERMLETNMEQTAGYGFDPHCERAAALIKKACGNDALDVHFLPGGTQANIAVLSAALRPHQGVLSPESGHINIHEAGAIEHIGQKVLPLESADGTITATQIDGYCAEYYADATHDYIAMPGAVYISFPTETGTLYTLKELTAIREACDKWNLILFIDGARLGYGLGSAENDVTLPDIARLANVFYIGGTKLGALFGEAVVIRDLPYKEEFRYHMKQNCGILAKGRLLGIQFEVMFEDGLYFELGKKATAQAMRIREAFRKAGAGFSCDSPTNQQFVILPDAQYEALAKEFIFSVGRKPDAAHTLFRVCTSWATADEAVDKLIGMIEAL